MILEAAGALSFFLGTHQGLLCLLGQGDIAEDNHATAHRAVFVFERTPGNVHPNASWGVRVADEQLGPVYRFAPHRPRQREVLRRIGSDRIRQIDAIAFCPLGGRHIRRAKPHDLLCSGIKEQELAVLVGYGHAIAHAAKDRLQDFLLLPEFLLRPLALGDVSGNAADCVGKPEEMAERKLNRNVGV